jgi:predicted MFS family arabinose efflux permease
MSAMFGLVAAIPALLIVRTVKGVGFSMQSTCAGAVAADVVPKSRINEGIGYFALHSTVAQAAGPGIALAIVASETLADYRLLFFISAGLCLMSVAASACITYERTRKTLARLQAESSLSLTTSPARNTGGSAPKRKSDAAGEAFPQGRAELSEVRAAAPLPKTFLGFEHAAYPVIAVLVLLYFGIVAFMLFIPPFARWRGFGNPWLFFVVSAAGVFVARIIFGKVADRRGADIVIIPWLVVLAACIFVIPFTGSAAVFIALGLPLGFAQGAVTPTFNAMLFKRCSPARRGGASGAFFASIDAGFGIGAPMLGALADARDFGYIFWAGAIFIILSLGLYLLIASDKRYRRRH